MLAPLCRLGALYADAANRVTLYHEVLRRLSELPGVQSAAAVTGYPGSARGHLTDVSVTAAGSSPRATRAAIRACSDDYFHTMGVPVLAGRVLADRNASEVVVNSSLARKLWPNQSPLGQPLLVPVPGVPAASPDMRYEVVGVVGDMRVGSMAVPEVFFPLSRSPVFWTDLVIRASDESPAVGGAIRTVIRDVAADALVEDLLPMRQVFFRQLSLAHAQSSIVMIFAVLALMVAAVGLYSLLSWSRAALQNSAFAWRSALHPRPSSGRWYAVVLSSPSWASPSAVALLFVHLLRHQLFGLQRMDPLVLWTGPVMV